MTNLLVHKNVRSVIISIGFCMIFGTNLVISEHLGTTCEFQEFEDEWEACIDCTMLTTQ